MSGQQSFTDMKHGKTPLPEKNGMKFITWNTNGLRAALDKGAREYIANSGADIVAIQETKLNAAAGLGLQGYLADWNHAGRGGYSGTLCLFRKKPLAVMHGIGEPKFDAEGRVITLAYPAFYFANVYVPNSQGGLDRWYFRLGFDETFRNYLCRLARRKPVIIGGDFNVAREYRDVYPENLRNDARQYGFLSEERDAFESLLDCGFADVLRELNPAAEGAYTWWSNRLNKRKENKGWRIDYFLVSDELLPKVKSCVIRSDIFGSDHAPLEMDVEI
jgi:exodeoxyribonuclease-3